MRRGQHWTKGAPWHKGQDFHLNTSPSLSPFPPLYTVLSSMNHFYDLGGAGWATLVICDCSETAYVVHWSAKVRRSLPNFPHFLTSSLLPLEHRIKFGHRPTFTPCLQAKMRGVTFSEKLWRHLQSTIFLWHGIKMDTSCKRMILYY